MKYCDLKLLPDHRKEQLHDAIDSVLQSGWYLRGEATERFERHYAVILERDIVWAVAMDLMLCG